MTTTVAPGTAWSRTLKRHTAGECDRRLRRLVDLLERATALADAIIAAEGRTGEIRAVYLGDTPDQLLDDLRTCGGVCDLMRANIGGIIYFPADEPGG